MKYTLFPSNIPHDSVGVPVTLTGLAKDMQPVMGLKAEINTLCQV